jgi:hypothetical protein
MQEIKRQTLVRLRVLRHPDGHITGPYWQRWADATLTGRSFRALNSMWSLTQRTIHAFEC